LVSKGSNRHKLSKVKFSEIEKTRSGRIQFKTTPYRWVILFGFCGLLLNLAMATVGLASYVAQIKTAFGTSQWSVILLMCMPNLLFAPMNFFSAWFFANFKVHHVLRVAACLQLIGGWVRALSFIGDPNTSFWLLLLGQFLFVVTNPFVLGVISLIANLWFGDHERAKATAISGLMVPVGSLIGLGLAGYLAAGVDSEDPVDCMDRLKLIVYAQNIIFSTTVLFFLLAFREKPLTPPSKLAFTFLSLSQRGIIEDIRTLSKNRNFMLNMTVFIIVWGSYIAFGNILAPMFSP